MSSTVPKGEGLDDNVNRGKKITLRVYMDRNGEYRWKKIMANGRVVADSGEGYNARRDCLDGMKLANSDYNSPNVRVVDHTIPPLEDDDE